MVTFILPPAESAWPLKAVGDIREVNLLTEYPPFRGAKIADLFLNDFSILAVLKI
jgi:hypothetical protein